MAKAKVYYATGKRKTSAARVFLSEGSGKITVNGRELENYIPTPQRRELLMQPLRAVDAAGRFDLTVTVIGGGLSGQSGAIRHGIARALLLVDNDKFRPILKKAGLLTRDSRMVERKKYGKHKARRSTQFSKR